MRYRRFMSWTVPACVLWALAYVSVGALAAGSYRQMADRLHYAGYVFVGIIVAFVIAVLVGKKVLSKLEARHMNRPAKRAAGETKTLEDPAS